MPRSKATGVGPADREALARLAERVGDALVAFAADLRNRPLAAPAPDPESEAEGSELTPREELVCALPGLDSDEGISSRDVVTALGWKQPNAHEVLTRLERKGLLTGVDVRPRRWVRAS